MQAFLKEIEMGNLPNKKIFLWLHVSLAASAFVNSKRKIKKILFIIDKTF